MVFLILVPTSIFFSFFFFYSFFLASSFFFLLLNTSYFMRDLPLYICAYMERDFNITYLIIFFLCRTEYLFEVIFFKCNFNFKVLYLYFNFYDKKQKYTGAVTILTYMCASYIYMCVYVLLSVYTQCSSIKYV